MANDDHRQNAYLFAKYLIRIGGLSLKIFSLKSVGMMGTAGVAVVIAIFMAGAGSQPSAVVSRSQLAAEGAFLHAMKLRQTLVVPPSNYTGGPMSQSIQSSMIRRAQNALSQAFTARLAARELSHVKNALHMQSHDSMIALAGGIQGIHYHSIQVTSSTATIHAFVSAWSKIAQIQTGGRRVSATPHNTLDVRATLTKTSTGQWQVSQLAWHFTPQTAP